MKWTTINHGFAAIELAASIIPAGTSFKDDSTMRATIGIVPIVRGTIEAVVPMDEPTIHLVTGINKTSKMRNGNERNTFTRNPIAAFTTGFS
jgi:hypothetical protein